MLEKSSDKSYIELNTRFSGTSNVNVSWNDRKHESTR
jgi:hypothetical protein